MSRPLEVLWVTAETPDRDRGGGGAIRQSHLIGQLARRATVDLLVSGEAPDAEVRGAVRHLTTIPRPERQIRFGEIGRRLVTAADATLPGGPSECRATGPARRLVAEALSRRGRYDAILVEHLGLSPLLDLRRAGEAWLLTLHNLPSATAAQAFDVARSRRHLWVLRREFGASRRREEAVLDGFDSVITVSEDDAAMLPGPTEVVPNGVDVDQFTPFPLAGSSTVLFTGSLNYLPNVDGLEWFCRDVWPRVRDRQDARLVIVGRAPVDRVCALVDHNLGVSLHPDVESVVPYLRDARMAVVPLRHGSGTRLKALEALASARPLVGTSTGLAGLGLVAGKDALIHDDVDGLSAAIVAVLEDDDLAEGLSTRGPEVARRFSWGTVGEGLYDVVMSTVGRVAGGR
ncbi:MAG TPA: glycosyltransferase [Mycobacteriales bacterium]|nr:glycosyltransferase [Mycobacteriales bacterium]